jgi:hypothetical protein
LADGPDGGFDAGPELELLQDVFDVDLDGPERQVQLAGDQLVAEALGEQAENLALARGEAGVLGRTGRLSCRSARAISSVSAG